MLPHWQAACAQFVHPVTLGKIIHRESHGDPWEVNVNGARVQPRPARSRAAAIATAERFIRAGYSVDLGRMQVNSRNLAALGVTVPEMLNETTCANIHTGGLILQADYARAVALYGEGQAALQAALSAYNTGSFTRGFTNGYVAAYYGPLADLPTRAATVRAASAKPAMPATRPNRFIATDTTAYQRVAANVPID